MKHCTELYTQIEEVECIQMPVDRLETLYGTDFNFAFTDHPEVATMDPVRKPSLQ